MKKIFSIILLLIISIQFLPVKQMGKCLFDNQFIEEEMAKAGIEKPTDLEKELIEYNISLHPHIFISTAFFTVNTKLHTHPVTEITTPPPNA
ncbi:MAG: hypothetical protein ABJA37_08390 [Ferruginibacter sp.]